MMDTLMQELEGMQQRYSEEKQEFLRMQLQTKVKEKIQQDLGGLTDTVVREGCGEGVDIGGECGGLGILW